MEISQMWHIKPSFLDNLELVDTEGYFNENTLSDGLIYYHPVIVFDYVFGGSGYNTTLKVVDMDETYSHPAYEYTKFIIDKVLNQEGKYRYTMDCELCIMCDFPEESWKMYKECNKFIYYPMDYDIDGNYYCRIQVTFHNVVGPRLLLSNSFSDDCRKISFNAALYDRYFEYSRTIFGGRYGGAYIKDVAMKVTTITLNSSSLSGTSLNDIIMYVPWMIPDEIDEILYTRKIYPLTPIISYLNRNINYFVQYKVSINDIPLPENMNEKRVKLTMNKLFKTKRTRRNNPGTDKQINVNLYKYEPFSMKYNIYSAIMDEADTLSVERELRAIHVHY